MCMAKSSVIFCRESNDNREFKQSSTAGATTAAVTEKVWGEYVSVRSLNFCGPKRGPQP